MSILSMRLDGDMGKRLAEEAERESKSRSELVREAISVFLATRERERFLSEIARAARMISADEAIEVAEESVPLDNEALAVNEPRAAYRSERKTRRRKR